MTTDFLNSSPPLLYRTVQDRIKRYIVEHELVGGDALPPETHLARDLGTSRPVVREAVKGLESLGILEVRQGRGLYVRPFSLDPILNNLAYSLLFDRSSVADVLEVRELLEAGLLQRAINALTPTQVRELHSLLDRMREKQQRGESFTEEDRLFHSTIAGATGNGLIVKLLDVFWVVFNRLRDSGVVVTDAPEQTWRNHVRILQAIEVGDAAAAQEAMIRHFDDLEARIQRAGVRERRPGPLRKGTT